MGYKSQPHERFGPGISTGLAAGPNWQWAVFKGLCECVERDAFMITYLNRLPVPEIDLTTVTSARIQDLLHRIPAWEKIEIRAWQMTLDIGIPAILAITHTPGNESAPAIACGAAVHVNPEAALFKAILESLQTRAWITHFLLPTYQQRHFALDFSDVSTRPDHLGLASQSGYLSHLDWLLSQREKIPFAGLADVNGPADLDQALSALAEAGFSAITCDLTTPDVAQAGFHVCRVLIPGLQQLTFGPIRLLGNPRLYSAPYHAGITPAPTQEADTNPVPHPFP
jgi:ribosomal protein S12 methylthiotransferase accessory factor